MFICVLRSLLLPLLPMVARLCYTVSHRWKRKNVKFALQCRNLLSPPTYVVDGSSTPSVQVCAVHMDRIRLGAADGVRLYPTKKGKLRIPVPSSIMATIISRTCMCILPIFICTRVFRFTLNVCTVNCACLCSR